jgi:subtilisin family serine protease
MSAATFPAPAGRSVLRLLALVLLAVAPPGARAAGGEGANQIVVAVADVPDAIASPGSTLRGYGGLPAYSGGSRALPTAPALAPEYGLRELASWPIEPLHWRCMLYEAPATEDRADLLARLAGDARVRLAQPLQEFRTLSTATPVARAPTPAPPGLQQDYNDPYIGLQHGFAAIGADEAQRWGDGRGVRVAVIDTGVDRGHPDLAGRIAESRDFVPGDLDAPALDRHGTEVAGVIAAVANNGIGIAGIAPRAELHAYRACVPTETGASSARCTSYTLALALGAAIAADARLINLSLGGPPDPLLTELTRHAIARGAIVVGALPIDGRPGGFPTGIDGVIAVASAGQPVAGGQGLTAPGEDILTLEPGGHYDYASGSSLAAAHASGAMAVLLQLRPALDAAALLALLRPSPATGQPFDLCHAVLQLGGLDGRCR